METVFRIDNGIIGLWSRIGTGNRTKKLKLMPTSINSPEGG